jgi:hypothetical protein
MFPMHDLDTFLKTAAVMFVEMWDAVKQVTSGLLCVGPPTTDPDASINIGRSLFSK